MVPLWLQVELCWLSTTAKVMTVTTTSTATRTLQLLPPQLPAEMLLLQHLQLHQVSRGLCVEQSLHNCTMLDKCMALQAAVTRATSPAMLQQLQLAQVLLRVLLNCNHDVLLLKIDFIIAIL